MFVQPTVDFLSHAVSRVGLRADAKKLKAITELSFPKTEKGVEVFLGALNYYCRFIQDFAVYGAAFYHMREEAFGPGGDLSTAKRSFTALQAKAADAPILRHFDRAKEVHVMLFANEWALSTTLMQEHDGVMHPVRFCGRVLKDNVVNYHPAEKEVLALLLLLNTWYTQLAWLRGHAVSVAPGGPPSHRNDSPFAQLLHSTIPNFVGLDKALELVAPPSKRTPMVRMDPELLYARLQNDRRGFVLSFDCSAKTPKHGGYGSCAWNRWRLPDWKIEIAASAYLESTTVNQAEYMGMNEGLRAAQAYGATDLDVVGDSRLAIQQSLGVAWKRTDRFVLSDDVLLYFLEENRRWGKDWMNETILRLVVPTTMVQEVLQNDHDLVSAIAHEYWRGETPGNDDIIATSISDEAPANSRHPNRRDVNSRGASSRDHSDDDHAARSVDMDVSAAMSSATRSAARCVMLSSACTCLARA
ncbi:unnamed protein product [Phytophthora fragariaefolia]|uniref:Unnamed protein product n=1 Tax=Phytophthora fragariaefolia TaxID=1490495 RepID=A0A9W6X6H7_9STRA|nr:unnamed protein product [Phytophthora fragariaefolia]